jgi:hypothetical protein
MEIDTKINLVVMPPLMSQEQFSVFVGKPMTTIVGWVNTKVIPTVKVGGSRLIDFNRLQKDLLDGKEHFAAGDYDAQP